MVAGFVERALQGKCAICGRRLTKHKHRIALYSALVNSWDIQRGEDSRDVEVSVCGEKCLSLYNRGVVAT